MILTRLKQVSEKVCELYKIMWFSFNEPVVKYVMLDRGKVYFTHIVSSLEKANIIQMKFVISM